MSQNSSTISMNNEITNFLTQQNIEQEIFEIQQEQQFFSEIFVEILGINVKTVEEKKRKASIIKKINKGLRQTPQQLRIVNKIRKGADYTKKYSNIQIKSNKQDDYLNVPLHNGNQQKGYQETLEIQDDLITFPLSLNCNQSQNSILYSFQDINTIITKVKKKIN
ncbi:unnamed protein product [Paramecium pentaurelia]|uniref:Uncharacterized protein n=1 Tax=Paramecium pentaurelia TaxID=43138 RepID=A0A8S1VRX3_9CILI|nr:unnamed protein product [Paramecium pentaurelia]